ncbi:hypothetical protein POM88_053632 [Heracleum sosnowskyi]|uniref:Uncharacterized protein n=1 Tax=Heracleum sosnowskyi TaxID=360622 RepID=A0AAD8LXL0_9APIA|nr:hypothetical protein POM88_053632 [Heracleum sosnowskyi]
MRRNIYSQRPEDDDEEMKEELNDILEHYHPGIVSQYWMEEIYCILERRQYKIDVNTTDGFEVGVYPYLAKKACSLIHRYYCPPDTTLPDYGVPAGHLRQNFLSISLFQDHIYISNLSGSRLKQEAQA